MVSTLFVVQLDPESSDIMHANVFISPHVTDAVKRHLCLEIVQSLGLMNDTCNDPASVFYQDWTYTPALSADGQALLRQLYAPEFRSGQTLAEVRAVLAGGTGPPLQ
eukprot:c11079_g1_i1.p2 GENE.c11079_g1_i1~~c11079_g1_i1.p2  ORF type:complete len:107 (+),score=17.58 c11079_g1_i1:264-584(+)